MKTIQFIAILFFATLTSYAQTDKFTTAMQKGLNLIDSAKTADDYTAAGNYFERIATAEQKQWLPQYYVAFNNLHAALMGKQDAETKDAIYDKAMLYAEKANTLMPNNSEVYALQAYITFMKMAVAPQARAMSMIPKATALADKAISLNPENPRAYLMKGQNLFYTPEMFGGGKAKAKPVLTTAVAKFDQFKAVGLEPNWGKGRAKSLLEQSN